MTCTRGASGVRLCSFKGLLVQNYINTFIRNKESIFKYKVITSVGLDQIHHKALRVLLDLITPRQKLTRYFLIKAIILILVMNQNETKSI